MSLVTKIKTLLGQHRVCALLLLTLVIYFAFGFHHLARFETADEHYWTSDPYGGRIHQYWKGISERKWGMTFINDKPGITLAYVAGVALPFADKIEKQGLFEEFSGYRVYNLERSQRINWLYRVPILVFNGLFSLVLFWFIKKITGNEWIALWSTIFIILSPILLGISQIINPDALFWEFVAATILAWLIFLKTDQLRFALLAGFFFGFSLLTKYVAMILVPFLFLLLMLYLWRQFNENSSVDKRIVIRSILGYWLSVLFGAALLGLLFPALIVAPTLIQRTVLDLPGTLASLIAVASLSLILLVGVWVANGRGLRWVFQKTDKLRLYVPKIVFAILLLTIGFVIINWVADKGILRAVRILPFDTGEGGEFGKMAFYEKFILEVFPIVFSLTPLVLGLWMISLWRAIRGKGKYSFLVLALVAFLVTYFGAVVFQELYITPRYGVALYPIIALLAGVTLFEIVSTGRWSKISKTLVTVILLAVSVTSLLAIRPFYFNYTNLLLHQKKMIADAWGYGGYEAAQYINELPDAEKLTIWVDYNGVCPFLKSRCMKGRQDFKIFRRGGEAKPDYLVKTRRGSILYESEWWDIKNYMLDEDAKPVWRKVIGGREGNYIEIYKVKDQYNLPAYPAGK